MKTKQLVLGISLITLTLASGVIGFSGIVNQKAKDTSYKNWMSGYSDLTMIKNLNIPGTQDSMALRSIGDLAGQCQSLSLKDQLNIGVRFLDIRLQLVGDELIAVHGIVDQRDNFSNIVSTVESFLKENPSEFIMMSIKKESDDKRSTMTFDEAIKKHTKSDYWDLSTTLPTLLGNVRKKIVLISRYQDSTIGVPAYNGWKNSETFTMDNGLHIQDEYKVEDIEHKKTAIKDCLEDNGLTYQMKINFLSGYKTSGFPPSYAPSVANEINSWFNKEIKNYPNNRGIVLYDFVASDLMKGWFE